MAIAMLALYRAGPNAVFFVAVVMKSVSLSPARPSLPPFVLPPVAAWWHNVALNSSAVSAPPFAGAAAEGLRQGMRLVVVGCDHVRVSRWIHAFLRGGPGNDMPQDPQLAKIPRNPRGNGCQRVRAVYAVRRGALSFFFVCVLILFSPRALQYDSK